MSAKRFALDQNFPQPIVAVFSKYIPEAELVPIGDIHPRLPTLDDWQVLHALHAHRDHWDGLITNDSDMLALPREMSVLIQTRLTLVVADAAGHDPIKATGLVLTHLPGICERTKPDVAQLWLLSTVLRQHEDPWERLKKIAQRAGGTANQHYKENKLSDEEMSVSPLTPKR